MLLYHTVLAPGVVLLHAYNAPMPRLNVSSVLHPIMKRYIKFHKNSRYFMKM